MDEADLTTDSAARNALMKEAEALAMADMPNIPIYHYVSKDLVSTKVEGWVDNTKDIHRTAFLSIAE
jgi:oligopeptide transport system substrate-binding protein